MTSGESTYAFANALTIQRERLALLASLLDPGTFALLKERGVEPGWRCLEVGAGGGSVAEWLCGVVGGEGSVLATDLDTTVLQALRHPNLEVRAHDLLIDELPPRIFDLVHARLLLAWLSDPEVGLRRMLGAVKPGGCLVVGRTARWAGVALTFMQFARRADRGPRRRVGCRRGHRAVRGSEIDLHVPDDDGRLGPGACIGLALAPRQVAGSQYRAAVRSPRTSRRPCRRSAWSAWSRYRTRNSQ